MILKDNEVAKINNSEISRLEQRLAEIDKYENDLVLGFDKYIDAVLGDISKDIFEVVKTIPNIDKYPSIRIRIDSTEYNVPKNFLKIFHKSLIKDASLRSKYEERLRKWFESRTEQIANGIPNKDSYTDVDKMLPPAFALASLALTTFHKKRGMYLRDVQKLTAIAMSEGKIAELGTGEGKTLAAVLPTYLHAIRGKGAHVITANNYLAHRDYEETLPIYEGLGLSSGYLPDSIENLAEIEGKNPNSLSKEETLALEEKLKILKQEAYRKNITYGSKQTFAFDYLKDNSITKKEDMIQRVINPGFALIDEVDDALIDDAQVPYRIATFTPMYKQSMNLQDLCKMGNISYDSLSSKVAPLGISTTNSLSYEEARYIVNTFIGTDLLPDTEKYQELAQLFYEHQKVLTVEDNRYGFKTGKELYEAIKDESKYDSELLRKTYGIIFCKELGQYMISDKCFDDFLKQAYFAFQINSQVINNEQKIKADTNYKENEDYYFTGNRMKLTLKGANRILNDTNYPDFIEDYNRYLNLIPTESGLLAHYMNQTIIANLLMKNGEDYIVADGKVKTVKNGRIQEESSYSNGLHQAIEIKEKIPKENRTRETEALSTVTQKDYYSRYDMFAGMTGTSSKEMFREIYGKETVEIPKNAFYTYYSRRRKANIKEPRGIEIKNTIFANNRDDKIKLILKSVQESQKSNPKQPVLIVVSNTDELKLISDELNKNGITNSVLSATDSKELEAMKIARAGLPGNVTISTEMAGRGTDIKIGGDRDTIIDIETERYIKNEEIKNKTTMKLTPVEKDAVRQRVETSLLGMGNNVMWSRDIELTRRKQLETIGLKVISSGYFKVERVDRQIEGRTGRNGISGICERYACPDDIKNIGLTSFNSKDSISDTFTKFIRRIDGSLAIDDKNYEAISEKINTIQKNNEMIVKQSIKQTQKLDSVATKLVENYRNNRRKIVCESIELNPLVEQMIDKATDGIVSSYVANRKISKTNLTLPIQTNGLGVDVEAISLEAKQILGVSFDPNLVTRTNMNLIELRDSISRTAKERFKSTGANAKKALLQENDFMIANIPSLLEHSFTVKRLSSMSVGMENQADYNADMEFVRTKERLSIESCKEGTKTVIGIPLTKEEFKLLEMKKSKLNEYTIFKSKETDSEYDISKPKYKRNNESLIDRFKRIKERIAASEQKKLERAEKKVESNLEKDIPIDIQKIYASVKVRPMKFMNAVVNGKTVTKLVLVRTKKNIEKKKAL